jgi:hypothetical protein
MVAGADDVGGLLTAAEVLGHSPDLLSRIYAHTVGAALPALDGVARIVCPLFVLEVAVGRLGGYVVFVVAGYVPIRVAECATG